MMYGGGVKQKLYKMTCIVKFVVISAFKNVSITVDTQDDKCFLNNKAEICALGLEKIKIAFLSLYDLNWH